MEYATSTATGREEPQIIAVALSGTYVVPCGTASVIAGPLNFPNGIVIGPDGGIYVSVNSVCPASGPCQGQVIRLAS